MKIVFRLTYLLLFFLIISQIQAQQLKENEVVIIQGEKFYIHQVKTGETVFSITRQFKVDYETLVQHNPKLMDGLKIGEVLKIPYNKNVKLPEQTEDKKGDPARFEFHTITSRKETPYFIAKNYNIKVEEIYAYNPEVRRFRKGTKLRIPVWEETASNNADQELTKTKTEIQSNVTSDAENIKLIPHEVQTGETVYSIAKKYAVSESEILFYNPEAKNLRVGAQLFIPVEKDFNEPVSQPAEEKTEVVENANYFEHIIESGQTLWGTARKYGVSENEIIELNPVLQIGFQAGMVIKIPVTEIEKSVAQPINDDAFEKHFVEKGETLYGLGAKYNLKISEIKKYNPVLEKRNLVFGETILIPVKPIEENITFAEENTIDSTSFTVDNDFYKVEIPVEIPESCKPAVSFTSTNEIYNVALFLPLFLEANDTLNKYRELDLSDSLNVEAEVVDTLLFGQDSLIEQNIPEDLFVGFYSDSENYLEFYEGVLMAVDSMQKIGMKIELTIFDTQRSADSIRKFIYTEDFLQTDLILGPVFENVQKEVAEIAAKNNIPFISPLVSNSGLINGNSNFYQVNPSREYLAQQTAELVAEEYYNSNFIVFKTKNYNGTPEGNLVDLIQEKLFNSGFLGHSRGASFSIYDFQNEGPFGFRSILSKQKENVIYIPTSDEGELSVAISNINNLSDEYSITLIGTSRYPRFLSIDVEQFHNLKLEYLSPYWTDYNDSKNLKLIEQFKKNFYTEPGSFGMQGFDISFYFLNALKMYGKDFIDCLPYLQPLLMQGTYQFEKVSQFGGYMNQGVSVVKYRRNYEVERMRIKGQYNLANN